MLFNLCFHVGKRRIRFNRVAATSGAHARRIVLSDLAGELGIDLDDAKKLPWDSLQVA